MYKHVNSIYFIFYIDTLLSKRMAQDKCNREIKSKETCEYNVVLECLMLIKIKPDTTVYRYLFTAESLYMFRVSQHPSSGLLKTVTAASGTGHDTGRATYLQRGRSGHVGGK